MPKRPPMQPIQDMKFGGGRISVVVVVVVVVSVSRSMAAASAEDLAVPTSVMCGTAAARVGGGVDGARTDKLVASSLWAPSACGPRWDWDDGSGGGGEAIAAAGDTRLSLHAWISAQGLNGCMFRWSCSVRWWDGPGIRGTPCRSGGWIHRLPMETADRQVQIELQKLQILCYVPKCVNGIR